MMQMPSPLHEPDPQSEPQSRPRVAVVTARLGIPSEIWMLRQARAFRHVTPVLIGGSVDPVGGCPEDIETHLVEGVFGPPAGVWRKGLNKLGCAEAYGLSRAQRSALAAALRDSGAQAVLCHFTWTAMAVAQAVPKDMPVIWHVHGRDVTAMLTQPAYRAMLARQLPQAAAVVAVGRHQLDRLAPFHPPARQALIPCGAPLDLFARAPLPDQTGDTVRFVSVGRMSHEKGMVESLRAFEIVAADVPGAELVLIGFGALFDEVQAMVAASPVGDRVRLTGRLGSEEIAAELAAAQVYLQHSREYDGWVEGFGVTLTEAGAAGLPLVASASGGLVDQIEDGENGVLFPPGDVAAQAAAMLRLARDPGLRAEMGAAARRLAARFDAACMAARLEDEILSLLGG